LYIKEKKRDGVNCGSCLFTFMNACHVCRVDNVHFKRNIIELNLNFLWESCVGLPEKVGFISSHQSKITQNISPLNTYFYLKNGNNT